MEVAAAYAEPLGFDALAADQILFFNYQGGQGPSHDYWGCGTWSGSTFVRRYGPTYKGTNGAKTFPNYDPAYAADIASAIKTAKAYLTAHYPKMKLVVNHGTGLPADPNEVELVASTDGELSELGTSNHGNYASGLPAYFKDTLDYMEYVQQRGVAFLSMNVIETGAAPTDAQTEWTLATYLMGNEGNAYMWLSGTSNPGFSWSWFPEYDTIDAKLGTPCAKYAVDGANPDLYARRFTGGLVLVNASPSVAAAAALPLGHTYTDLFSRAVATPLPVSPADAYVLFTTNGCQ